MDNNRIEAFRRLFGEDPAAATDADGEILKAGCVPDGGEFAELGDEIEGRVNAFLENPGFYIDNQTDERVRGILRAIGRTNRDVFTLNLTPMHGEALIDPFAEPVAAPPVVDDPPPDPPPREPPPREPPQAPELPQVLRTFVAAVNGAYPSLAVAVQHDAWPRLRQEIEDAHRAAADQADGACTKLIRLSLRIHARVLAETSSGAVADAAKAYADAAVGGFAHSSYQPQRTYELAWRIAVGHPYVPL